MKKIILLSIAAALAGSAAIAASSKPQQARIPFANSAIQGWSADGDHALYINANGRWYHAELLGYCRDLNVANAIGFAPGGGTGDFDSFSTILVDGQRCPLTSLVKSDAPPRKAKIHK